MTTSCRKSSRMPDNLYGAVAQVLEGLLKHFEQEGVPAPMGELACELFLKIAIDGWTEDQVHARVEEWRGKGCDL